MSQRGPVCRTYNTPQGCRYGSRCKFLHDRGSSPVTSPPRSRSQTPGPPSPIPNAARRIASGVPRNVCQFFWSTGACARGFECTFRHVKQSGAPVPSETPDPTESDEVDFFSTEGLTAGSTREDRNNLNPSETHNHLKEFTHEKYRFDGAGQIQGFVRILASVNDSNKTWPHVSRFLTYIIQGNALHRIGEILRFEPVRASVGFGTGSLSFQRGYLPIFQFLATDLILKSTLHKNINHLYSILKNNHESAFTTLRSCLGEMMAAKTWMDQTHNIPPFLQSSLDGIRVFRTLSVVFLQYFNRYKDAVRNHAEVASFIQQFADWFETWAEDVSASQPRFKDALVNIPAKNRELSITHIREDIHRLQGIVERETGTRSQALAGQLAQTYDPPGGLREEGRRHDNDFDNIAEIRIAPTHEELFAAVQPYLPVFRPDAPHYLPMDSMDRHLDIQFRLLREDLISSTRASMAAIQDDLLTIWNRRVGATRANKTTLEQLLQKNGGAYRTTGYDSVFFQIYTNVEFLEEPPVAQRRGVAVTLVLDAPPVGSARDKDRKKRYDYWEHSKRLQGSTLVTLVVVANRNIKAHLGVVSSFGKDLAESSKHAQDRIQLRVAFFDPEVELKALQGERLCKNASSYAFLVDNSVMFESVRPFLEKMQTIEPTSIPFARYIAAADSVKDIAVMQPKYATAPGFKFKLQCLAKKGKQIHDLDVLNPAAVIRAREQLRVNSVLDPSQADAVVDTLTREVSLIQGYTAKEILRVMFASKIRPIVLIAFTNHALDHMVTSVLDANITTKIVRLGTRSTDERIMQFTLDKLEKVASAANLDRSMKRQYATMKKLEEEMTRVMTSIRLPLLDWDKIGRYLSIHYPDHADAFEAPPFWITELTTLMWAEEEESGEWQDATKKKSGKNKEVIDESVSHTLYGFWRAGKDIQFLQTQPVEQTTPADHGKGKGKQPASAPEQNVQVSLITNPVVFFAALGFDGRMPSVPARDRPLANLLADPSVWAMSLNERTRLTSDWEQRIRMNAYTSQLSHYRSVRDEYREACQHHDDLRDEVRPSRIVGPKVLLVEEAGQVLEAHILASLVPSVRHLICIGDPQQLRPTLANFSLSMDSERGKQLFKLDRSLMERLVDNGFEMSQINVQRRMRPTISHFIRTILYPKLEDNALVFDYPPVQGMQSDVFFYNHLNKEGGSEDSVSKYNTFEVEMIRDLVLYFLRQGAYSGPGDIAVLCAYLGQLQKVRAALRDMKIAVAVDERDAEELARQGIDEQVDFEEVLVAKHVRLGTVDIFQGQEAKIVIVSLVRNSGQCDTGSASIGFLKSSNRINVALSRAKHGLYVMGNAANLRKNPTWSTILDEMEERNQIGCGFPIRCTRHPAQATMITKPGQLSIVAPVGGCLLPCGFRMNCGHICPSVCHAAPDNHRSMKCPAPCNRTPCPRKHPCPLRCSDDCGHCQFPMYDIGLPCGHTADVVPCHQLENLISVKCFVQVRKQLPSCEHFATVPCHLDPAKVSCKEQCAGKLQCCTKRCKAACGECQRETSSHEPDATKAKGSKIARIRHVTHPCERPMYCQHNCGLPCSSEHECNTKCKEPCRQQCVHHRCPKPCSDPCAPCMEPCVWSCAHFSCPVLCGSICSRLPCDEPCTTMLKCGHRCPSVCGERCEDQKCVVCLDADKKADIVDFIMQRRLEEIDLESTDVSDRLITLSCGHIYTVETLDGHCGMSEYYEIDQMGRYISTKSPPINYQTPPMCPTCRGPITALRYGRVTKRATLDILEQNVASTMSGDLDACSPDVSDLTASIATRQEDAKKIPATVREDEEEEWQAAPAPWLQDHGPLPATALELSAMKKVHGVLHDEAMAWNKIITPVIQTYRRVVRVSITRGAHVKAYESALTTLYRLEMMEIANNPARGVNAPEPLALATAKSIVGQPPPKADVRFQVEAYFLSLELRSLIAQVAQARADALTPAKDNAAGISHRERWTDFVAFLYTSCIVDAKKARDLADNSSATRQAARASLFVIRYEFELFRWQTQCKRTDLCREGTFDADTRKELAHEVQVHKVNMLSAVSELQKEYIRKRPSKTTADMREERQWFDNNCRSKVDAWQKECDTFEEFLLKDGVYQPLSLQEREDIVKAFGFSHRGHFYNCENGHTFVITECGGAMQASRCPECRAPIGGSNHTLHGSNTRATEFETIAGQTGSQAAPWPWARGA
ncbi:hypothetical protein C2E23DRAFT_738850 [Lenzites betulinus]|nr:hypothetical protein C2E23DRAFT_738850 [Lenzites betulinus]